MQAGGAKNELQRSCESCCAAARMDGRGHQDSITQSRAHFLRHHQKLRHIK